MSTKIPETSKNRKTSGKKGRPPIDYPPETWDELFHTIATTTGSTQKICEKVGLHFKNVWRRLGNDPDLRERYAQAKEEQSDLLAEEIIDIADAVQNDFEEFEKKNGEKGKRLNREHFERSRLRIDARKWIAAKLKPKKYGDRVNHDHEGSGFEVHLNLNSKDVSKNSNDTTTSGVEKDKGKGANKKPQ